MSDLNKQNKRWLDLCDILGTYTRFHCQRNFTLFSVFVLFCPIKDDNTEHIYGEINLPSHKHIKQLDLGLPIDPLPRRNFVHYDFLKLLYISHKIRHVSKGRVVALLCYSNITYVTL